MSEPVDRVAPATGVSVYPTGFGRGWIPEARDVGLQGERLGVGTAAAPVAPAEAGAYSHSPDGGDPARGWMDPCLRRGDCGIGGGIGGEDGVPGEASSAPERDNAFTTAKRVRFLDALAREGSVRAACAAAAISAESVYRLRRRDAVFAAGWAAALVLAREAAGEVLATRALYGVDEPIFYRGEQVGSRHRFDARLLLAHVARLEAAALDPQARRDAARFDELLAAVAGIHADADMYEFADPADDAPAPVLPMTRDAFAAD